MPDHPVLRIGNPNLRRVAEPVIDFANAELDDLIEHMWSTMALLGGVGLAAPQIDINKRLVVFGMQQSERYPEAPVVPRTVLINPVIEPLGTDMVDGWEGCLSVPGMRGLVPRHHAIRYTGRDERGEAIAREVQGFHARLVQHECDHLDGILYTDRMHDMSSFGFEEELLAADVLPAARCE